MKLLRDLVLVEVDEPKKQTASGLYITEEWKTLPQTGTVKAVGPLVTEVIPGQRVSLDRYSSILFKGNLRYCLEKHLYATDIDDVE